ncbi:MAG: 4-hydroxy-tetrahydrodipicolinate synthase [Peptococcaceae bacterium]|jgi:4-hydroxy-tetrahydrodipicolinate synthase|nr:4-hydroxy-tetrahydrodipicolinate synthase [Peptococcaceae bacterium]
MSIFTGAGCAIITPFTAEGAVDYPALDRLLDFQIDNGTDAIIICGTTGESSTLSEPEHSEVIAHTVKYVNHRVPVIAGTGSNDTQTAIMLSKQAEDDGADAVLVVTPYYNKATQNGLKMHFKLIAEAINIPVILYNVPSRTGCNIQPETAVWLARNVENIVAIKEATGNISQIGHLFAIANGDIDVYSGNDDQIVPLLSLGGKGVISVLSNIAPQQTHDIVQHYLDGDVQTSAKMQLEAMDLINALFCEVNPIPVKKAAELMNLCGGSVRLPLTEIEAANAERLANAMREYGLLK